MHVCVIFLSVDTVFTFVPHYLEMLTLYDCVLSLYDLESPSWLYLILFKSFSGLYNLRTSIFILPHRSL